MPNNFFTHVDDGSDYGSNSKDTVLASKIQGPELSTKSFDCNGTSNLRHRYIDRDSILLKPHRVKGGSLVMTFMEKSERLSPFDCEVSWYSTLMKCTTCYLADADFESRGNEYDKNKQKETLRKRKATLKKNKTLVLKKAKLLLKPTSVEEKQLLKWMNLVKKLKVPEMKLVCEANNCMVGGSKDVLLTRLIHLRRHGGSGVCKVCRKRKLNFEYDDESIMSIPIKVACRHYYGDGNPCSFIKGTKFVNTNYFNSGYSYPLIDTDLGLLSSKGIAIGSQLPVKYVLSPRTLEHVKFIRARTLKCVKKVKKFNDY